MDSKKFKAEYKKYMDALSEVGQATLVLIEPLVYQAVQLKLAMDEDNEYINKHGRFEYSNKGNIRECYAVQSLAKNTALYQKVYKSIEKLMSKNGGDRKTNKLQAFLDHVKEENKQ